VRVQDLKVTGFAFSGVFFFATIDQSVNDVLADGNQGYGIAAFNTTGGQYWDNVTPNNHEAGIYVGDSPSANALVKDNVSYGNLGFGVFVRDASHGRVEDNEVFDNCIGILFLDTPGPTESSDWVARDNDANHNNQACPAGEDSSAVSGLGIVISSAHRITLADNTANGNQPGGPTEGSAGIAVVSEAGLIATGNVIKHNTAFGNLPVDIFWDQQGDNTFTGNRCNKSDPDGLCAKGEHGHGHHGDVGDDDHGEHGHHHGGAPDNGHHRGGEADNGHHRDTGHHRAKHEHKHKKHKKHHKGKRHGD
jgi:nitrous oxidase accessory protein NosD